MQAHLRRAGQLLLLHLLVHGVGRSARMQLCLDARKRGVPVHERTQPRRDLAECGPAEGERKGWHGILMGSVSGFQGVLCRVNCLIAMHSVTAACGRTHLC